MFKTLVLPILTYGLAVYGASDSDLNVIQRFLDMCYKRHFTSQTVSTGGAGSEVWNRVYMIAPVKKFGRVRLSTNFP